MIANSKRLLDDHLKKKYIYYFAAFVELQTATTSFVMTVRLLVLSVDSSAHRTTRPSHWKDFREVFRFYENLSRIFNFHLNFTRITGILHEDQYKFSIISRSVLLRMRNVSDLILREIKTRILCSIMFSECRRLHNEELNDLYCSPNIVRVIKSRRMRWAGHVAYMAEERSVYRSLMAKPEGKRPLGRPRRRWVDNIRMDLQEVGCGYMDWIGLVQDRDM